MPGTLLILMVENCGNGLAVVEDVIEAALVRDLLKMGGTGGPTVVEGLGGVKKGLRVLGDSVSEPAPLIFSLGFLIREPPEAVVEGSGASVDAVVKSFGASLDEAWTSK